MDPALYQVVDAIIGCEAVDLKSAMSLAQTCKELRNSIIVTDPTKIASVIANDTTNNLLWLLRIAGKVIENREPLSTEDVGRIRAKLRLGRSDVVATLLSDPVVFEDSAKFRTVLNECFKQIRLMEAGEAEQLSQLKEVCNMYMIVLRKYIDYFQENSPRKNVKTKAERCIRYVKMVSNILKFAINHKDAFLAHAGAEREEIHTLSHKELTKNLLDKHRDFFWGEFRYDIRDERLKRRFLKAISDNIRLTLGWRAAYFFNADVYVEHDSTGTVYKLLPSGEKEYYRI